MIKEILLSLLFTHVPPGKTSFSVEPADCPMEALECEGARRSSFYGGWVRQESAETARARYSDVMAAMVSAATELLCLDENGKRLEGCTPQRGARDPKTKRMRWTVSDLVLTTTAAMILESGIREDVMVGRGRAKKPSDDGGQGRGPSNEGCLVQIHPVVAWSFNDTAPAELLKKAKAGNREAREAVVQSMLGGSPEALRACFRTGMKMFIHARDYCAWEAPRVDWMWATYSLYGTGRYCADSNKGKTLARVDMLKFLRNRVASSPLRP